MLSPLFNRPKERDEFSPIRSRNLVNFIVIGIFINKNTCIIPTNAYVTYRSVKDTDNVSRYFFSTESTHVNPRGHLLEVISPL